MEAISGADVVRIGIAGPITIAPLLPYLEIEEQGRASMPEGLGGTPVVHLVIALLKKGHDVVVFTLDYDVPGVGIELKGPHLTICIGPFRRTKRARDFFAVERRYLMDRIKQETLDVVHAHWTYEYALAAIAAHSHVLCTVHDAPLRALRYSPDPYRVIRVWMAWMVARRASLLSSVSSNCAEHFRKRFFYKKIIHVIPNMISTSSIAAGMNRTRCEFPPSDAFVFLFLGTGVGKLKNGKNAIRAFQIVRKSFPNIRLVMVGDDNAPGEATEQWAENKQMHTNIEFLGRMKNEDLILFMAQHVDLLLHTSREESFGMAIVEAMATGVVVVGGEKSGAVPELLKGGAGVLANIECPAKIAEAVESLLRDQHLRATTRRNAIRRAITECSEEIVVCSYESLYAALITQ